MLARTADIPPHHLLNLLDSFESTRIDTPKGERGTQRGHEKVLVEEVLEEVVAKFEVFALMPAVFAEDGMGAQGLQES